MAEAALRRMTVAEFLDWDSGDDRRYELFGGAPLAMAPPSAAHAVLTTRVVVLLDSRLTARPQCTVLTGAGLRTERDDRCYIPDLMVTCGAGSPGEGVVENPVVVVEILSPSTEDHDRKVKLPDYRALPSVREIVLLDSRRVFCEVHRRLDGDVWRVDLLRRPEDRVELPSIGVAWTLGETYAGLELDEPSPARPRR